MNAKMDPLEVATPCDGAGFAKAQGKDLITRDDFTSELVTVKTDIVRWMLRSQVMLIGVLVALANFTTLLAPYS